MYAHKKWWLLIGMVYLLATWFSSGYNQSDEHFQILEFAGLHLGVNSPDDLAWEYHTQMRPGLQPAIAYGVHRGLGSIGLDNPFIVAWFLRLLSALFSLGVAYLLYRAFRDRYGEAQLGWWFFLFSFLSWFVVYNGIRFNSENWSGNCFALAVGLYAYWQKPKHTKYLLLGCLVGLAFVLRYQVALMIAGWGLWLIIIAKEQASKLITFTLGGVLAAAVGIVFDYWLYGEWTISAWNYFEQNILLDKASEFGVDPWWYYIEELLVKGIPPFSIFYLLAIVAFFWLRPKHWLTWTAIPFLLVHFLIAHKELRFWYPLLPYLPIAMAEALHYFNERYGDGWWKIRGIRWLGRLFWGQNIILLLFITFWSIIPEMGIYRQLYQQYSNTITLYGIQDNPYQQALEIRYYQRPDLRIKEVEHFKQLPTDTTYLLAFDQKHANGWPEEVTGEKQLIYSSYPDWIYYFNFNNWLARTQWWYIYEIRNEQAQ